MTLIEFEQIESCPEEALDKVLINFLFRPEQVYVFLEHFLVELLQCLLAVQSNGIEFLLVLVLLISAIFLRNSFFAFGQICLF